MPSLSPLVCPRRTSSCRRRTGSAGNKSGPPQPHNFETKEKARTLDEFGPRAFRLTTTHPRRSQSRDRGASYKQWAIEALHLGPHADRAPPRAPEECSEMPISPPCINILLSFTRNNEQVARLRCARRALDWTPYPAQFAMPAGREPRRPRVRGIAPAAPARPRHTTNAGSASSGE